jgi:uncharacterized protein YcbX
MKIASLYIYPVKGMRAFELKSARVEPWGLAGDRRWAVIGENGKVVTQREQPRLATIAATPLAEGLELSAPGAGSIRIACPDAGETVRIRLFNEDVEARPASGAQARWLTDLLGTPCRLVHLASPQSTRPVRSEGSRPGDMVSLADAYPVLLASTASLAALNRELGDHAVPMDRFRPNIVVDQCDAWEEEEPSMLSAGTARFRGATSCERCVVVTVNQRDGTRAEKTEPLRSLTRIRPSARNAPTFGRNLLPEGQGVIEVGQPFVLRS